MKFLHHLVLINRNDAYILDRVKQEKELPFSANKYFFILKMGLELRITKLTEFVLQTIQVDKRIDDFNYVEFNFRRVLGWKS
jgi:hypothetical protein